MPRSFNSTPARIRVQTPRIGRNYTRWGFIPVCSIHCIWLGQLQPTDLNGHPMCLFFVNYLYSAGCRQPHRQPRHESDTRPVGPSTTYPSFPFSYLQPKHLLHSFSIQIALSSSSLFFHISPEKRLRRCRKTWGTAEL